MQFNDIPTWKVWKDKSSSFGQFRKDKPYLVRIDNLIKQYEAGASVQYVQQPLLVSLQLAVEEWYNDKEARGVGSGRFEAMEALAAVVKRKLRAFEEGKAPSKTPVPPSRPYRDVVCIGYTQVVTDFKKAYFGVDDDRADVDARWAIMKEAIKLATDAYKAEGVPRDVDEKRLKIFMAPEFYFRGKRGGYKFDELFYMVEKVREVTVLHPHWLFVLGTLIVATQKTGMTGGHKTSTEQSDGSLKFDEPTSGDRTEVETGMILDNYAIIQKGGYAGYDGVHDLQVAKENVSNLDFHYPFREDNLKRRKKGDRDLRTVDIRGVDEPKDGKMLHDHVWDAGALPSDHVKLNPEKMANARERSEFGCIFEMDGITFGLEVCLDHAKGRLSKAPDKGGVQIHLIPSAGMDIRDNCSSANTIRFNVDGIRYWRNAGSQARKNPCLLAPEGLVEWWFKRDVPADKTYFPYWGVIQAFRPLKIPS
jgi:hypothetical protein